MADPVWDSTQADYDWNSGTPEPSWSGDCATWLAAEIFYGQFSFLPSSGSSWAVGYRPGSLTISGPNLGRWLTGNGAYAANDGYIGLSGGGSAVLDNSSVLNGDTSITYNIVVTDDITGVYLQGDSGEELTLCDVVWGASSCTQLWTNHLGQQEVSP